MRQIDLANQSTNEHVSKATNRTSIDFIKMFRCPSTVATSAALILIFLASAQAAWMNKVSNVANVMAITADNEGSVFIGGRCLGD